MASRKGAMRPGRGAVRIRWPMGGRRPPAQGSEAPWGQGPAMERPWTASTGIRAMGGRKNNHVFGPFFISVAATAWKSNPWRTLRHGVASVPTTIPRKDGSPSEGPKNGIRRQKTPCVSSGIKNEQRRINFPDGRFRLKSAKIRMQFRMHFSISRAEEAPMTTDSRAKACSDLQPYALLCTVCSCS